MGNLEARQKELDEKRRVLEAEWEAQKKTGEEELEEREALLKQLHLLPLPSFRLVLKAKALPSDYLIKPQLLRAIVDSGFEQPSEDVCISHVPLAIGKVYESFSKYMSSVRTAVFIGGMALKEDETLPSCCRWNAGPHLDARPTQET
ncbi:Spliceosome RNA helicase DDX39B [Liparis tanakae]|uniref:Spliceosome RNA helicase DDX39B n=1 Tax=Liparis tanakae TaxID=230148 RepID=A0A4Z2F2D3_9TELE|nr:Spliceosome RNA helicase DDX39B [Liparis tanakae]